MSDFVNELSFSASRETMLAECPRRYYYAVYLVWNGWWRSGVKPESRRAAAYEAKHVTTEAFLAGKIVHGLAEWVIKQSMTDSVFVNRFGGRDGIREQMHGMAGRRIDESLAQARGRLRGNPKKCVQLVSVVSGGQPHEQWLRERVRTRINALCADDEAWDNGERTHSNLLFRAARHAERVVHCEELIEWKVDTTFGATKAYLAHDLVVRSPIDPTACTIVDWKTGAEVQENGDQLEFYAAWAAANGWRHVDTATVYLGDGVATVRWATPDLEAAVLRASRRVFDFVDNLRMRLVGRSTGANVPIESAFEPTSDPSHCLGCNFAIICERDGTKPKAVDRSPPVG